MKHPYESFTPNPAVDEKGLPLEMPPEFMEEGEDEPVYERAPVNQSVCHHYAVR